MNSFQSSYLVQSTILSFSTRENSRTLRQFVSIQKAPIGLPGNAVKHFSQCFRYRWVHPSGALIGSYRQPLRGGALLRFHTGGSNVSPNQTLLPPSKLGGELEPNDHVGSGQLLPPSGPARTEGLSPKKVHFISENASKRCLCPPCPPCPDRCER